MIHFDIEWKDLLRIGQDLDASEKQVKLALAYSLRRTAARLRTLSLRGLKNELALGRIKDLRNRLKSIRLRKGGIEGVQLWYGLNDMPVSWFKAKPQETATGAQLKGVNFTGGFVGKSKVKGKKTIFKRAGKSRLAITEQLMPVEDKARIYVEDRVFDGLELIFWPIFNRELRARVKYKIGGA